MRSACWLLIAACVCCSAYVVGPPRVRPAGVARCAATVMKKGRGQGGGPKISTRKTQRKTEGEQADEKRAAALKRRIATSKRRPTITPGRQEERYTRQCASGAARHKVFARVTGDLDWLEVGHVSIAAGSDTTPDAASRLMKRLILEHAAALHPTLLQQSDILECGVAGAEGSDEDDAAAQEQVVLLSAGEAAPLLPAAALRRAATCGFLGLPLPSGHYFGDSEVSAIVSDDRKVTLSKLGNNAKSAVAVQQSKTLGLRSLG